MKKAVLITFLALMVISLIGFASAKTLVAGKIYNADFTAIEEGATVNVTCTHNAVNITKNATSNSDGAYAIEFSEIPMECTYGDALSVYAFKAGVGENTVKGVVSIDMPEWSLNIGVVNVPLIPEFGIVVGIITVLSAVTVFFVIRRK